MILVHNHPSGDPNPSIEDVQMTRAVAEAGDLVGVTLLDHVVVARDGFCSVFDVAPGGISTATTSPFLDAAECRGPRRRGT
jgi:DNA repair protein RadC